MQCVKAAPQRRARRCEKAKRRIAGGGGNRLYGCDPLTDGVPSFHSVWPLAERYEALLRVFNDPAGYAKRLAKRLYARAVACLRALFREPREARHRIDLCDRFESASEKAAQHFLNLS